MNPTPCILREKDIASWFLANKRGGPGSFEVTDLRITASDTGAYCHALLKIFGSTARLTMGLRKERGQWLVPHEHHSYPSE
jgi:ketosteroid isomerase-like protein